MSMNGDILVMRNGRSTSQISVYNYPEHLNPFYEDDQHKRLRFWKISKQNGNDGRRNSFSISNLKDMWAFKSFKLKKKSSTLGVNKTSESPPPLRRDIQTSVNGFNTFDVRQSKYSAKDVNQFERSAPYRTSLQNVSSLRQNSGDFRLDFERNNQYRSTIQGAGILRNQQLHTMPQQRRPSQSSMISANPFDTDDEEIKDDISVTGNSITDATKRTPRKKRRAPRPPITLNKSNSDENATLSVESSQSKNTQDERLHIEENNKIANLTAEIESFVKTKTFESPTQQRKPLNTIITKSNGIATSPDQPRKTTNETASILRNHESSTNIVIDSPVCEPAPVGNMECIHVHVDSPHVKPRRSQPSRVTSFQPDNKNSPDNITAATSFTLTNAPPPAPRIAAPTQLEAAAIITPNSTAKPATQANNSDLCELKITEEVSSSQTKEIKIDNVTNTSINSKMENSQIVRNDVKQNDLTAQSDQSNKVVCQNLNTPPKEQAELPSLQIVEEKQIDKYSTFQNNKPKVLLADKQQQQQPQPQQLQQQPQLQPQQLQQQPQQHQPDDFGCSYRMRMSNLEWKKSSLAPLEENVPREKRKSVKDIIESINRSQRLLKAGAQKHQTQTTVLLESTVSLMEPSTMQQQSQKPEPEPNNNLSKQKHGRMLDEAAALEYSTDSIVLNDNDAQPKLDNQDIFKKCRVNKEVFDYRETSPTSSNLDWNPLPKPKRAKNLTES